MSFLLHHLYRRKSRLIITGLLAALGVTSCLADDQEGLNVTMSANIVENTCQISLSNNGEVHLPIVSRAWFYNGDGTTRLQPADAGSGTRFSVNVESCENSTGSAKTLTFRFQPQTGSWPPESKQVFINETPVESGGAQNVGIVVFSSSDNRNVLENDGNSAVIVDVSNVTDYLTQYDFYARYQNLGIVSAGKVTSRVLVDAIYQ